MRRDTLPRIVRLPSRTLRDYRTAAECEELTFFSHRAPKQSLQAAASLDARADVDLWRIVGIACKAHLISVELGKAAQPARADFDHEGPYRHRCKVHVPDARGSVQGRRDDALPFLSLSSPRI